MSKYTVTIARAALDENPEVFETDDFYEVQDRIIQGAIDAYGADYTEEDFEQFTQLVRIEEL